MGRLRAPCGLPTPPCLPHGSMGQGRALSTLTLMKSPGKGRLRIWVQQIVNLLPPWLFPALDHPRHFVLLKSQAATRPGRVPSWDPNAAWWPERGGPGAPRSEGMEATRTQTVGAQGKGAERLAVPVSDGTGHPRPGLRWLREGGGGWRSRTPWEPPPGSRGPLQLKRGLRARDDAGVSSASSTVVKPKRKAGVQVLLTGQPETRLQ